MKQKTVLITGASRGIGAATARVFAQAGYCVAANYQNSEQAVQALAQEYPGQIFPVQADVADRKQVEAMFEWVRTNLGAVDVLVCNAGIAKQELFTDVTP